MSNFQNKEIGIIYDRIHQQLKAAGLYSDYDSDADEKDPRYKAFGVKMPEVRAIYKREKAAIKVLNIDDRIVLAQALIFEGIGELQSVGILILSDNLDFFTADNINSLDSYIKHLFGWSKIDMFVINVVQKIFRRYQSSVLRYIDRWSLSEEYWERRASVVAFTRDISHSGDLVNHALKYCDRLKDDKEDMVQKGVGWCLKDLLKSNPHKEKILQYVITERKNGLSNTIFRYILKGASPMERKRLSMVKV